MRTNAKENGQINPSASVRVVAGAGSRPHLAFALQGIQDKLMHKRIARDFICIKEVKIKKLLVTFV
jgi:hypothetical protein